MSFTRGWFRLLKGLKRMEITDILDGFHFLEGEKWQNKKKQNKDKKVEIPKETSKPIEYTEKDTIPFLHALNTRFTVGNQKQRVINELKFVGPYLRKNIGGELNKIKPGDRGYCFHFWSGSNTKGSVHLLFDISLVFEYDNATHTISYLDIGSHSAVKAV